MFELEFLLQSRTRCGALHCVALCFALQCSVLRKEGVPLGVLSCPAGAPPYAMR